MRSARVNNKSSLGGQASGRECGGRLRRRLTGVEVRHDRKHNAAQRLDNYWRVAAETDDVERLTVEQPHETADINGRHMTTPE